MQEFKSVKHTIKEKWNQIYRANNSENLATSVLLEHACLLPDSGVALDIACGLGANSCFLAKQGLATTAWDISEVAIAKLQQTALSKGLSIKSEALEITQNSFIENSFDIIIISRFLDRSLSEGIISALKPGGMLFYQTFNREKIDTTGPNNPDFLLAKNELLTMFASLKLVFYQENGKIGDLSAGLRNEVQFIAQKS
jgi:2-polyprenyl-3-methyl-5-hydroxy-6-metoxy-1,4-benzoquinol methylase